MREFVTYEMVTFHSNCLVDDDTINYLHHAKRNGWTVESTIPSENGGYTIKLKRPKKDDNYISDKK